MYYDQDHFNDLESDTHNYTRYIVPISYITRGIIDWVNLEGGGIIHFVWLRRIFHGVLQVETRDMSWKDYAP